MSNAATMSLAELIVLNNIDPSGTLVAELQELINPTVPVSFQSISKVGLNAALPPATYTGQMIYVSDATGAHVTGSMAFSNGTSWIDVTTGVAVA